MPEDIEKSCLNCKHSICTDDPEMGLYLEECDSDNGLLDNDFFDRFEGDPEAATSMPKECGCYELKD